MTFPRLKNVANVRLGLSQTHTLLFTETQNLTSLTGKLCHWVSELFAVKLDSPGGDKLLPEFSIRFLESETVLKHTIHDFQNVSTQITGRHFRKVSGIKVTL